MQSPDLFKKILIGSLLFLLNIVRTPWFWGVTIGGTLAFAIPQLDKVISGEATISSPNPSTLHIQQTTPKAIIQWHQFNIGAKESTHFYQPAGGIALNRINASQGASQIYGILTATGKIILVNPAGFHFGPTAYVNVGGLIATTIDIADDNFIAGRFVFDKPPLFSGSIINEGTIVSKDHGLIVLVGSNVTNTGLIQANVGSIALGVGDQFTLNFAGNQLISFVIDEAATHGVDEHGHPLKYGVENYGTIIADGGRVLVDVHVAQDVLDHVINTSGMIEAKSCCEENGVIVLYAGDKGSVNVSGSLIATGTQQHEKGGEVKIRGKEIILEDSAVIDVSGHAGGGTVLIGGSPYGAGPEPNADYTFIAKDSRINASGLVVGDGGVVVVWSNKSTRFYGDIIATGGLQSGKGGFVETSGKEYLEAMGFVNTSATKGQPGIWLLDPANVTISTSPTLNGVFNNKKPNTFTTTANDAIANVNSIIASLNAGTSVTILTSPAGTQSGNITVSSPITKTSGGQATLTLTAANTGTIFINQAISSTVGNLSVVLSGANAIALNAAINTLNGAFTATTVGTTSYISQTAGTITTGSGARTFTVPTTSSGSIGTSTQPILISGTGNLTITAGAGGAFFSNTGNLTLNAPTLNANSPLTVISSGKLTLPNAVISTGTGSIDFESRGNTLSTRNDLIATSGSITLYSSGLLTVDDNVTTSGGNISLTGLGVTQSSSKVVNAGDGNIIIDAGSGSLTMGSRSRLLAGDATGSKGSIRITADTINLNITSNPSQIGGTGADAGSAQSILIQPSTAGTSVGMAGGAGTLSLSTAELNLLRSTNLTLGSNTTGNIVIGTAGTTWAPATTFATNLLTLSSGANISQTETSSMNLGTRGLLLRDASLVTLFNTGNTFNTIAAHIAGSLSILNSATTPLTISSLTDDSGTVSGITAPSGVLIKTSNPSSSIILNAPITTTIAGDAIILVGAAFTNHAGLSALNPGIGRFLVWSTNPASDIRGGLNYNFKQYDAIYGSSLVQGTGSGFLYSVAPIIIPGLTGTITKIYDTGTAATLAASNYLTTGDIDGDMVILNNPTTGLYGSSHVGSNLNVSVTGIAIAQATDGSAIVYGYQLSTTSANANIGTITPATVTASLTGDTSKVYDTLTTATLSPENYVLSGVLGSDTLTLNNPTSGTYITPNVGTDIPVSVSGLAISGPSMGDYQLASTTANATIGTITPATLTVSHISVLDKTYNATTNAVLNLSAAQLHGVLDADNVSLLQRGYTASFETSQPAQHVAVTVHNLGLAGPAAGNYVLTQPTGLTGNIVRIQSQIPFLAGIIFPSNFTQPGSKESMTLIEPLTETSPLHLPLFEGENLTLKAGERSGEFSLLPESQLAITAKKVSEPMTIIERAVTKGTEDIAIQVAPDGTYLLPLYERDTYHYTMIVLSLGLLVISLVILEFFVLLLTFYTTLRLQSYMTKKIAYALSLGNSVNYTALITGNGPVIPVSTTTDASKFINEKLLRGYTIHAQIIPPGKTVKVTIEGPLSTKASFLATRT